mmetsp:Transcript_22057/g.66189  ORF Transcript_22057/g.66189 Transcript_22057/m.66189 type:complete len:981 (+) Transcript_22057:199-3141(+)
MPTAHAMAALGGKAAGLGKKPEPGGAKKLSHKPASILKGPFARMHVAKKAATSSSEVTPEDRRKDSSSEPSKARKALAMSGSARSSGSTKRTKATTPFALFFKHNLDRIKAAHPGLGPMEQMDKLNEEWGLLPMDEKREYEKKAEAIAAEAAAAAKAKAKPQPRPHSKSHPKARSSGGHSRSSTSGGPLRKRAGEVQSVAAVKRVRADASVSTIVSPFKVFREERRQSVKLKYPHLSKEDRAAKLKEQFRALSAEDRLRYQGLAHARNAEAKESMEKSPRSPKKHKVPSATSEKTDGVANSDVGGPAQMETEPGSESDLTECSPSRNSKRGTTPTKPKGMKTTSPRKGKGAAITDFFRKTEKKGAPDLKPLTAEQQAKLEKDKLKIRKKLMTKKEREAEKLRIKEEKQRTREETKRRREEEKKRRKEEEKRQRQEEIERAKPREDTDPMVLSESAPLPLPHAIASKLPAALFGDVVMLAEFIQTFASAFSSLPRDGSISALELEDVILQLHGGNTAHAELLNLVACFVVVAFEVGYGPDSCDVDTELALKLRDLPVNMHTASDVLRLYLIRTDYASPSPVDEPAEVKRREDTLKLLETSELAMLSPVQIVDVLNFLSNKAFSNSHFMDKVEDAVERIPQIKREQYEMAREEAREKKAAEEAAKKASKEDDVAPPKPEDADAALAALLFEKENSRSGRRVTRRQEETPQEKAARETLEDIERKARVVEEREEKRIELADELVEQKNCLKGRVFGFDRNWSQYRLLSSIPGLIVQTYDGQIGILKSSADFDALMDALNERGLREKALKAELQENHDLILRRMRGAGKIVVQDASMKVEAVASPAEVVDAAAEEPYKSTSSDMVVEAQAAPAPPSSDLSVETTEMKASAEAAPAEVASAMMESEATAIDEAPTGLMQGVSVVSTEDSKDSALATASAISDGASDGGAQPTHISSKPSHVVSLSKKSADARMLTALKVDVTAFF